MVGYLLRLDKLVGEEGRTESKEEGEAFADMGAALSGHVGGYMGRGGGVGWRDVALFSTLRFQFVSFGGGGTLCSLY